MLEACCEGTSTLGLPLLSFSVSWWGTQRTQRFRKTQNQQYGNRPNGQLVDRGFKVQLEEEE